MNYYLLKNKKMQYDKTFIALQVTWRPVKSFNCFEIPLEQQTWSNQCSVAAAKGRPVH